MHHDERYPRLARALGDRPLPAALVDLDLLDRNLAALGALCRLGGRPVRVASKSVRCVELLRYAVNCANGAFRGVMAFSAHEALKLAERGFDDVLLAYPVARAADADAVAQANALGAKVSVVADDSELLGLLSAAAVRAGATVDVLVDVDVSLRLAGDRGFVGVRRSPVRGVDSVVALARDIAGRPGLSFGGVMAYEAQIAGVADDVPGERAMSAVKRWMKRRSRGDVEAARRGIAEGLRRAGMPARVFNGGGTGSLAWCSREEALTEVTAGSGLLGGTLFDHYRTFTPEPALVFALAAVRRPADSIVTCFGGGYIASGAAGPDRLPTVVWPPGSALLTLEGAGEVQTPVRLAPGVRLPLGAPVFFRHAKPGELAERFNHYLFVRGDRVEREVATYRGEGWCFG